MRELLVLRWFIEAVLWLCEFIDCFETDFFILVAVLAGFDWTLWPCAA